MWERETIGIRSRLSSEFCARQVRFEGAHRLFKTEHSIMAAQSPCTRGAHHTGEPQYIVERPGLQQARDKASREGIAGAGLINRIDGKRSGIDECGAAPSE